VHVKGASAAEAGRATPVFERIRGYRSMRRKFRASSPAHEC